MNFWNKIMRNDIAIELKKYELRAQSLPNDYQEVWKSIKKYVWRYSDFTGRNILPVLKTAIDILEEISCSGINANEGLGNDLEGFCDELVGEKEGKTFRDSWRKKLNNNVAKKLIDRRTKWRYIV